VFLTKFLELLRRQQLSITQQFRASVFCTVVHRHKLSEVASECTSYNCIVLAICVPKIIKFSTHLTKLWHKQVGSFFGTLCRS